MDANLISDSTELVNPDSLDWSKGDFSLQLAVELAYFPNSPISILAVRWYNFLYRKLSSVQSEYLCRPSDLPVSTATLNEFLASYSLVSYRSVFVNYFVSQLNLVEPKIAEDFLKEFNKEVSQALKTK